MRPNQLVGHTGVRAAENEADGSRQPEDTSAVAMLQVRRMAAGFAKRSLDQNSRVASRACGLR